MAYNYRNMKQYAVLLRGINVGGKNKVSMSELKKLLAKSGFEQILTYINSGNILLYSDLSASQISQKISDLLTKNFQLDSSSIKVLTLNEESLATIIRNKPKGFGEQPEKYHSDVIFLINITPEEAILVFQPREDVDTVWVANDVIYSQRVSALLTKSRLNKIVGTVPYQSMTIRNWNTVTKLEQLMVDNSVINSD